MAEVTGLVLGALGIAGLFKSCIDNFDIVVRARDFGENFDLLCTELSLQQVRLGLWGESLGFIPAEDGKEPRINQVLDRRPQVRRAITDALLHLQNLLTKADVVTGRYELSATNDAGTLVPSEPTSLGMMVFRDSFRKLRSRMRQNQKDKSTLEVTRWAVHDYAKFKDLLTSIKNLIDGLESVTASLGLLERQRARLVEEIESISDTQSLRLLQNISSTASSGVLHLISDRASQRISCITSGSRTYHTAPSKAAGPSTVSIGTGTGTINHRSERQVPEMPEIAEESSVPQNQRWIAALLGKHGKQEIPNEFNPASDMDYGRQLAPIKKADEEVRTANATKLLIHADGGVSLAQRMFTELRSIRRANVPFISAVPVQDRLDRLLASVEGPPGTPYDGGIFWITVQLVPQKPPLLRFQTRVYHPNIDCNGNLCADYASWWTDANLSAHMWTQEDESMPWFSELRANHYSLGALLVAVCGLLSSPNIDDPLVPEIAEKHITNYAEYYDTAKLYTKRYATGERPSEDTLRFAGTTEPKELLSVPRISAEPSIMTERPGSSTGNASTRKAPSIDDAFRYISEPYPLARADHVDGYSLRPNESPEHDTNIKEVIMTSRLPLRAKLMEWRVALATGPANNVPPSTITKAVRRADALGRVFGRLEKRMCPEMQTRRQPTWHPHDSNIQKHCGDIYEDLARVSKVVATALNPPLNGWSPPPRTEFPQELIDLEFSLLTAPGNPRWARSLGKDTEWAKRCWVELGPVLRGRASVAQWTSAHGRTAPGTIASIAEMEHEFALYCGCISYHIQCAWEPENSDNSDAWWWASLNPFGAFELLEIEGTEIRDAKIEIVETEEAEIEDVAIKDGEVEDAGVALADLNLEPPERGHAEPITQLSQAPRGKARQLVGKVRNLWGKT
ncbi:prion-inhibition and propagation-domain-containing protein [Podospora aff. communis PSN243]|uniref:Prion-inhibition and propagation-domain-containing protein n=1 Tax=Podospora aff. communis PSN243 TaxID=3040156 RepID=A0AAV9GMR2_9PEZI|nr:prion-inhibition and propagation-domain-containing protein [Podospora aff. communis PSN243]